MSIVSHFFQQNCPEQCVDANFTFFIVPSMILVITIITIWSFIIYKHIWTFCLENEYYKAQAKARVMQLIANALQSNEKKSWLDNVNINQLVNDEQERLQSDAWYKISLYIPCCNLERILENNKEK